MSLLPSLPSFNFTGGGEKLTDANMLQEEIGLRRYIVDIAGNNTEVTVEFSYPGMTLKAPKAEPFKTFKPELNNNTTAPAKVTYNKRKQMGDVANAALSATAYHEREHAARADKVRHDFSDVLGDQ